MSLCRDLRCRFRVGFDEPGVPLLLVAVEPIGTDVAAALAEAAAVADFFCFVVVVVAMADVAVAESAAAALP